MMRVAAFCALGVALAGTASARTYPVPGRADGRITTLAYNPNQVFAVSAAFRHALQIQFGPNEVVTQAAMGDTVSWEIVSAGDTIFLKPREKGRPTNLIVLTNYLGAKRSYQFELGIGSGPPTYVVRFVYPIEDARQAADIAMLTQRVSAAAVENSAINLALDHAVVEGQRSLDYWFKGSSEIQPSEVSDNGEFTTLRFPGHADIPSIFGVNGDGTETIIPYDVREDFVVLHGVWRELRLRRGGLVLEIHKRDALRNERALRTGTVSPVIERTVHGDKK